MAEIRYSIDGNKYSLIGAKWYYHSGEKVTDKNLIRHLFSNSNWENRVPVGADQEGGSGGGDVTKAQLDKEISDRITGDSTLQEAISAIQLQHDPENPLHYTLIGRDGINLGEINIPKDQFLKSANYNIATKEIVFVFITETGEVTTTVDVSDFVETYTAGVGITITDNVISTIPIDLTSYYTRTETNTLLANKVDKISGKGLSAEDFTTDEKVKLASLENYDDSDLQVKINGLAIIQPPELFNYDDTQSNTFELLKIPLFILQILVLDGTQIFYYLQDSDYNLTGKTLVINSPTLSAGMKVKVQYAAINA